MLREIRGTDKGRVGTGDELDSNGFSRFTDDNRRSGIFRHLRGSAGPASILLVEGRRLAPGNAGVIGLPTAKGFMGRCSASHRFYFRFFGRNRCVCLLRGAVGNRQQNLNKLRP